MFSHRWSIPHCIVPREFPFSFHFDLATEKKQVQSISISAIAGRLSYQGHAPMEGIGAKRGFRRLESSRRGHG